MGRRFGVLLFVVAELAGVAHADGQVDQDDEDDDVGPWSGFHVDVTASEISGVVGEDEAYANQLELSLDPSYQLGRKLGRGWWKPLTLSASISIAGEVAGTD